MFSVKRLAGMVHRAWKCRSRLQQRPKRFASTRRLYLEASEDRVCPTGGYLGVGSYDNDMVLRHNESTGAFVSINSIRTISY
jgi:hypothetical protein